MAKSIIERIHELHRKTQKLVEQRVAYHQAEIDKLLAIGGFSAPTSPSPSSSKAPKEKKARQGKRTQEQIAKQAQEVVEIIKAGGKDGVAAKAFRHIKINGSPKDFLKNYAPEFKWKATGKKAATKYFAV